MVDPACQSRDFVQVSPDFSEPVCDGDLLRVGAAVSVSQLMAICQGYALSGLEFCAGVPASVGGMVAMNFGCWGRSFSDVVSRVRVVSRDWDRWLPAASLEFGYRSSVFHREPWVVVEVEFLCQHDLSDKIRDRVHEIVRDRVSKQPLRAKTFGSVFKNPEGGYAAKLLEECGYKGRVFGGVQLSDQHANFMVNNGEGTYQEVADFIAQIQSDVLRIKGILLEPEVKLLTC